MTNSRQKGKRGELEWRDVLRAAGWLAAERGQQHAGGPGSPDVVGGPAMTHAEVKYGATIDPYAAVDQSVADAGVGEIPYVAFRRVRRGQPNRGWLVILRDTDFLELASMREDELQRARMASTGASQARTTQEPSKVVDARLRHPGPPATMPHDDQAAAR